jgi:hypothetical protein
MIGTPPRGMLPKANALKPARSICHSATIPMPRSAHAADHVFCIFVAHFRQDGPDFYLGLIGQFHQR